MTRIKFAGLGGLNESGKNMYILEVNSEIFILDSGFSIPDNNNLGVKFIIPDFNYLKQNKDRIKGIFISHGHYSNVGSLLHLVEALPNIPIFTSSVTLQIIKILLKNFNSNLPINIFEIEANKKQKIGSLEIEAIVLSHSIPGTFGFIFRLPTKENIIYLSDYIIEKIGLYKDFDPKEFSKLAQEENLLLLSDVSSLSKSTINSASSFSENIKLFLNSNRDNVNKGKMVFSCYEGDIYSIISIIEEALKFNKSIYIHGDDTYEFLNSLIQKNEISEYKIKNIKNLDSDDKKEKVIIFAKSLDKMFSDIALVAHNSDPLLKIDNNDYWINMALEIPGNEKICSESMNELSKITQNIKRPKLEMLRTMSPSIKDLEFVLSFLSPKYFMPISAFYKEMIKAKEIAKWVGIPGKNVILAENGEIHLIEDSNYIKMERKLKEVGDVIVETGQNASVSLEVIKERKLLSEEGVAVIGIMWSNKLNDLASEIDVQMRGVMFLKKHLNVIEKIKVESAKILKANEGEKLNVPVITKKIERDTVKILRQYVNKKPIIIPHIMVVE